MNTGTGLQQFYLEFKWTVSRGRDTYGYNICTLYVDGERVARCNGGGYDMEGTVFGNFLARNYADRLRALKIAPPTSETCWHCKGTGFLGEADDRGKCFHCRGTGILELEAGFLGLTFHDPNYDPGKAVIGKDCSDRTLTLEGEAGGMTVAEAEAKGISIGLERYQAIYAASSKWPTERHTIPSIDGACGMRSVEKIAEAIGLRLDGLNDNSKNVTRRLLTVEAMPVQPAG